MLLRSLTFVYSFLSLNTRKQSISAVRGGEAKQANQIPAARGFGCRSSFPCIFKRSGRLLNNNISVSALPIDFQSSGNLYGANLNLGRGKSTELRRKTEEAALKRF